MQSLDCYGKLPCWLIGFALMTALPGCFLLPVYHQPQGFSTTYYRHLEEMASAQQAAMATQLAPPPGSPPPVKVSKSESADTGNWWSWVRNPLSSRTAANDEDDDESVKR